MDETFSVTLFYDRSIYTFKYVKPCWPNDEIAENEDAGYCVAMELYRE